MCNSVNKRLLIFLGMIALTTFGARATDYIDNEDQLKTIASQGGSASLTADIRLSSCLEIPADKEVTLYITDHTLSRALPFAEEDGHVILNRGKLTIQGNGVGTIAGGWATYGGGIYNAAGATLIINNITVSGNKATERGGGIANYGQMTVTGCTLTDNQAKYGAGMLVDQNSTSTAFMGTNTITQNVSSCDAGAIYFEYGILHLEGKPYFRDNVPSDVVEVGTACITMSGLLEEGASIGVNPTIDGPIAQNYQNREAPSQFFVSVPNDADIQLLDDGRVTYTTTAVYYLDRKPGSDPTSVSEEEIKVSDRFETLHSSESNVTLDEGWYIVRESITLPMLTISGKVNIIILNGKTLKCSKGIHLTQGNELHIYSQRGDGGILRAISDDDDAAGIGSKEKQNAGSLYVHSGQVYATGSKYGAGIGGGDSGYGGEVTIYGGTVIARSKGAGAGIGGGRNRDNLGNITIYGGYVEAYGYYDSETDEDLGGSGIGGGSAGSQVGKVTINGGKVYAHGGSNAAGIGGGRYYGGGANGGLVVVNGGEVYAYAGVTSFGSDGSGAGIGGGRSGDAGTLQVNGGTVMAFGGKKAPAVGRGSYNETTTGSVEFNGGKLIASSFNTSIPALGYGTVSIGNWSNNYMFILGESETNCAKLPFHDPSQQSDYELTKDDIIYALTYHQGGINYSYVRIEPCDHASKLISKRTATSHTYHCQYCYLPSTEEEHTLSLGKCSLCNSFILRDGSDNKFNLSYGTGHADHVILADRLLYKDGAWNTLCLPFSISDLSGTIFEGATIKTLESAGFVEEEGKLTLNFSENSLSSIEAGVPYIVMWPSEDQNLITDPEFNDVTISDSHNNKETDVVNFMGTYAPVSFNADPTVLYLGHGNTLYYPSAAMTINAFRAYFQLTLPSSQQVKAFQLNFGDEETGIKAVSQPSTLNSKLSSYVTLDGRRLGSKPTDAGLYIHNGTKVLIK